MHRSLERHAQRLAEAFESDYPEAAEILTNDRNQPNPVWRMAEALTLLQGRNNTQGNLLSMIDSCFLTGRPNGIASKRSVNRALTGTGRKTRSSFDRLSRLNSRPPRSPSSFAKCREY